MVSRPEYERAHRRPRPRPRLRLRLPRALAGSALAVLVVVLGLAASTGPASGAATASASVDDEPGLSADELAGRDPLRLTIDELAPSYIPEAGRVQIRGTVTNRTDETWTNINVYATFDSVGPAMRNARQIRRAVESPNDAFIGDRILEVGQFATVDELAPGSSTSYSFEVSASALAVPEGGVYWIGVQAIGQSDSYPRANLADGRARTLIPYVPPRVRTPLPTAITVPLTRSVAYDDDGSLAGLTTWDRALSPGGRLSRLLDFVDAAGTQPVTWVVDPAVPDAVSRVARGNPGRSLAPTAPEDVDPEQNPPSGTPGAEPVESDATSDDDTSGDTGDGSDGSGDDGSGDERADRLPDDLTDDEVATARTAASWLEQLRGSLTGADVMTLPYGHVDVPAAVRNDPGLLELARAQSSTTLEGWRIRGEPVVASPTGLLDSTAVAATDPDTTSIVSDEALAGDVASAPSVASMDGHRVVVASSGAAAGGPAPGPALTMVGLRQRILAEAAVRVLRSDPQPLVVVLPTSWALEGGTEFFAGLGVDWLDLDSLDAITSSVEASELSPDDLVYPEESRRREVRADDLDAVDDLIAAGDTLQNVLALNTTVGGEVTEQALSAASYGAKGRRGAARASVEGATELIGSQLASISVEAPNGVTLSSADGSFPATLRNDLDEPVRVEVSARTDEGLEVDGSGPIDIDAGSRITTNLDARATSSRVHNVTLVVSDGEGVAIGGTDTLPLRSAQVSDVIWLIMGTGAGLLFLAIAVRLVRRVRAARAGGSAA